MERSDVFPVSDEILVDALKRGIKVKSEGGSKPNPGLVSLIWHPTLLRWGLAYGTSATDAGFVLLEDYGRIWELR